MTDRALWPWGKSPIRISFDGGVVWGPVPRPARGLRAHLRRPFAWRLVRRSRVWDYYENYVTGQRKAMRNTWSLYSPVALDWLDHGEAMAAARRGLL